MQSEPIRGYHMRRATAELDLAYRATQHKAAEAHLRLSALHMARVRETVRPADLN